MIKIHTATYEIIEWKGEEYYRFSSGNWMQLMGVSLEEVYDAHELEAAYQALEVKNQHSSVQVSSKIYETKV